MTNFYTVTVLTLLIVVIFTGFNVIGTYIYDNDNLNDESRDIINKTSSNLGSDFKPEDFEEGQIAISENTSFEGTDPFAREFLEEQSEAETKTGIYKNLANVPTLIKESIGLPDNIIKPFWTYIMTFVSIVLIVVGFVLFFGRGKINK